MERLLAMRRAEMIEDAVTHADLSNRRLAASMELSAFPDALRYPPVAQPSLSSLLGMDSMLGSQPRDPLAAALFAERQHVAPLHVGSLHDPSLSLQPGPSALSEVERAHLLAGLDARYLHPAPTSMPSHPAMFYPPVVGPRRMASLPVAPPQAHVGFNPAMHLVHPPAAQKRSYEESGIPQDFGGGMNRQACRPSWDQRLQELREFKAVHGHCNVPSSRTSLYVWLKNQHSIYLNPDSRGCIKDVPLRDRRTQALEEVLGTPLVGCRYKRVKTWDQHLKDFKQFKAENGHCRVPKSMGSLHTWLRHQRNTFLNPKSSQCLRDEARLRSRTKELEAVLGTDLDTWGKSLRGDPPSSSEAALSLLEMSNQETDEEDTEDIDSRAQKKQRLY